MAYMGLDASIMAEKIPALLPNNLDTHLKVRSTPKRAKRKIGNLPAKCRFDESGPCTPKVRNESLRDHSGSIGLDHQCVCPL